MSAKETTTYRRLPGRARRRFGLLEAYWDRLWLADDHLLQVRMTYYSESYKRFYLKDIQAIAISRTTYGRTANLILGSVAALLGLAGLLSVVFLKWPVAGGIAIGTLAGIFAAVLVYNTLLGPTCLCRLHTAVHVEDLTSLGRLRTARKVVAILKPLIESVQGKLTPDDLDVGSEDKCEVRASVHALVKETMTSGSEQERRHEHGRIHSMLFFLLFILGISAWFDILYQHPAKNLADMFCFVSLLVLAVIAIRRQSHSDFPKALRRITWAAFGALIASYLFGSLYVTISGMSHPELLKQNLPLQIHLEGPVFKAYCIAVAVLNSGIAFAGAVLLNRFRSAYAVSKTTPVAETAPNGDA